MAIKKDLILDLAKNLETSDEENSIIIKFDNYDQISYIDKILSKSSAYYYYMNDKGKIVDVDKASILFISKAEDILESELDETEAGDIAPVEVPLFKNKVFKRNIFEDSDLEQDEDDSDYESEDLDPDFDDSDELKDLDFDFDDYIDSERNVTRTNNEISNSLKDLDLVQRVSASSPFGDSEKTFQELNITDNTDYGNSEEIDFDKLVNRDLNYVEPEEISKKFDFISDEPESQEEDPESFFITDDDIAVLDARDIGFEELNSFLDSLEPEEDEGEVENQDTENPSANDMEPPIKTRDEEDSLFDDKNSNDSLDFGTDDGELDTENPFDDTEDTPAGENPDSEEDEEENVNDSYDPEIAKKYTESIDVEDLRTKQRNKNRASYEQKHAKNSEESLEKNFDNSKRKFRYKSSSNKEKYQKEYERLN